MPQLAAKAVSDVVGKPVKTAEQAEQILANAAPETLAELQRADQEFMLQNQELFNERFTAVLQDKQNARKEHKDSNMPAIITLLLTVMVAAMFYVVAVMGVKEGNEQIVFALIGQVTGVWVSSVVYWVGTSLSSAKKNNWANSKQV